ncbi:unnamed protein product, partial [Ectocarpus fasciculatus]
DEDFEVPSTITAENLDEYSLYDVLGLKNNTSAGMETIKKAYRKAVLLYHPDKQVVVTNDGHEDDQTIFLKIQKAFATLSDESKRRAYDSQLDFDEKIPSVAQAKAAATQGSKEFCDLFRPVFDRNARFAVNKPVPSFGDEDTAIGQVHSFYSYWVKFDSWRDFSNVDMEHKPDEANDRYEKRWMQKENAIVARKLKKKEMSRINDLVMAALDNDPRILADKLAQKKAKEDVKLAKLAEAQRIEDEKAAAIVRAAEEKEQEKRAAKLAKEEREKVKKLYSRIRSAFRKSLRAIAADAGLSDQCEYGEFNFEHVEAVCTGYEPERLLYLVEGLGADLAMLKLPDAPEPTPVSLEEGLQRVRAAISAEAKGLKGAEAIEEAAKEAQREQQRQKAEEIENRKKGLDREWTRDDLSMLSKCLAKFPAGTGKRWDTICEYLNAQLKPSVAFEKSEVMHAAQNAMQFVAQKNGTAPASGTPAAPIAVTSPKVTPPGVPAAAVEWTQAEQDMLEAGLRKYPNGKTPEEKAQRWSSIAAGIPSKSSDDCMARFKFLRDQMAAKKTAGN